MSMIIPAILATSPENFKKDFEAIRDTAKYIQIDLTDRNFAGNDSFADHELLTQKNSPEFELHLMTSEPLERAKPYLPNPKLRQIIVHIEAQANFEILQKNIPPHIKIALALNPNTSIENPQIRDLIPFISKIQLMGVEPGGQGRPLFAGLFEKINQTKKLYPQIPIAIDGHMDKESIPPAYQAGAEFFGVGSAIFKNQEKSPKQAFEDLENLLIDLSKKAC